MPGAQNPESFPDLKVEDFSSAEPCDKIFLLFLLINFGDIFVTMTWGYNLPVKTELSKMPPQNLRL